MQSQSTWISLTWKAHSSKNVLVKAMFFITVFKIFLFKGRSVLSPTQRGTESERAKFYTLHCTEYI